MANQFYAYERGTTRYDANRPLYWDGMIGLMYSSDYGYAAGNTCVTGTGPSNYDGGCKNKDWLYILTNQWLMSPNSRDSYYVFYVSGGGRVYDDGDSPNAFAARPVFYLTSTTSIASGKGTSTDPYILS